MNRPMNRWLLAVLILLTSASPIAAEEGDVQLAGPPQVTRSGEEHRIAFAVNSPTDVEIAVQRVEETVGTSRASPVTRIQFEWKAKQKPQLFPLMHAELAVYPLTGNETQLDFSGRYEPPLGVVGKGLDAVVGKRIADASIHRFVTEVAEYLRSTVN